MTEHFHYILEHEVPAFPFLRRYNGRDGEHQAEATLTIDKMDKSKQGSRNHQGLIHWSSSNRADFSDNSTTLSKLHAHS